ncbi:hypothetical protein KCP73_22010 [Salmonella enterica subsp. enterica]|nr:hypothetical protein KCP73_22010 [Salmonella enterica subsp. enterica]
MPIATHWRLIRLRIPSFPRPDTREIMLKISAIRRRLFALRLGTVLIVPHPGIEFPYC